MFNKVFFVCAVVAVAMGIEYPPGIHPAVCPNYPFCDMEVLARHTPQGMPIPDWELPYARMVSAYPYAAYPYGAYPVAAPKRIASEPAAAKYPADVDPASCPNYPYCA